MGIWNKVGAWLIFVLKLLLYPIHFLLRLLARILLIVFTVAPVLIPLYAVTEIWTYAWHWVESEVPRHSQAIIGLIFLLSSLGLLANFLKQQWTTMIKALWAIVYKIWSAIADDEWMPGLDIKESLEDTWSENFSRLWSNFRDMVVASWRLVTAASLFLPVCLVVYLPIQDFKEWQERIEARQKRIEEKIQEPRPVVVVDGTEDVQYVFEKNQTFVLAHVEDADIESRAGICLDAGHQEWLTEFKKAIEQCADSGPRPELEVRAFSSTAPMALGGRDTPHGSALANCEAANQRAEAVVEFLLGRPRERWVCGSAGRVAVGSFENGGGQLCQRLDSAGDLVEEFTYGEAEGLQFDLSYKPWRTHEAMTAEKPADNGVLPGPRRYDAEFLNRAVHVTLKNDACKKTED